MSPPNEVTLQSQIPYIARTSDSTSTQTSSSSSTNTAIPSFRAENRALAPSMSAFEADDITESRTLGNIQVEAPMIDLCFERFDRYFSPLIPILSSQQSPNQTYFECPLKFWVLLTIGSRKCLEDPTLFSTLSPHVETLAMTSLCLSRSSPYPIIEGLLLMCTWHLSTDRPFFRNIYCGLIGAVVTLTLHAGMHQCSSLQGVVSGAASEAVRGSIDVARGTKLWAYAVISNQSTMAVHGYPINDLLGSRHLVRGHKCCATLPSWIMRQGRCIAVITRMHGVVSELELETDLKSRSRVLRSLITAFEAELLELDSYVESQGPLSKVDFAIARLQVLSFGFLTAQNDLDRIHIIQLSEAAILTMEAIRELETTVQISLYCPNYIFQGILLAACTLLKLFKSYPPKTFNEKEHTSALFLAINMFKNISVVNNDIPAKVSGFLTQLWSSPMVYREADGGYIQSLQVENRLTMSVVFDCLWWWRKLFADWLNEQPVQSHSNYMTLGLSQNPEDFFDDSWNWDIDWGAIGSLGSQALSFDESDQSPYNVARE
ncbi:hypothetical protein K505DRAFT_277967 [Melanomma pulvis-pyrius CBS 109.77]|uniref:Transcription factor domain-containing protein n=1 Tax=Melanomma pulvis-pyrius CBS 109.77 TaxID=1314802 RepID=A0A6A6X938_9PLEO|nr:hypothetical protein K505DRAFT_277967 [Melanomma pulvis-pyrius CBS 109.77]